jgi:hypothetical protein
MGWLDPNELKQLLSAAISAFPSPIPTQSVSSDEFMPAPQSAQQREFEARMKEYGADLARRQGMSRRAFFTTAAGMAAAFVAMNETYGGLYAVSRAEAATPEMAKERAEALSGQFIMDMHTHFLRDDTRLENFVRARESVGKAGWNPTLVGKPQTLEDLKFANYVKEIFLDSDTKVVGLSGAPSDLPEDWFLTNEMKAAARTKVNQEAGTRRMLAQAIFTPGQPDWLAQVDRAIEELKPDSFKGYTIGDNTNKHLSKYPWHMDDEKLVYPFYERCLKAGLVNITVHKGLFSPSVEQKFPHLLAYSDVRDVGKAAKDWPQLNFIIYHSGYRFGGGGGPEEGWARFEKTGRVEWVSDLAEIPEKSREIQCHQRLRRSRANLRAVDDGQAAAVCGHDGHPDPRARLRSRVLGDGCHLDRVAAMADRGPTSVGNSRGHAKAIRLPAAGAGRWAGQDRHSGWQQCPPVQIPDHAEERAGSRPFRAPA